MIEVTGEGVAKSPAGGCEVVAGEGGGVGGGHDARVGEEWPVGRVGLGREHIKPDAGEAPGVEEGEGGFGVEQGAAGDVDEPGAGAHGSEHGLVDEGRLPGAIRCKRERGVTSRTDARTGAC